MSEEVKRVGRDLAYEGTVIKVYKDHMKFANGNTAEWDFIHHDGAAAVVPVMDDGKISWLPSIVMRWSEIRLKSRRGNWMRREPELKCASRELEEETGYRSDDLEWLITLRQQWHFAMRRLIFTLVKNLIPVKHPASDEDEFIKWSLHH